MVKEALRGVETSALHRGTEYSKLALDVRTPFRYTYHKTKTDRDFNRDLSPGKYRDLEIELYEKIETVRLTHITARRKTKLPEP